MPCRLPSFRADHPSCHQTRPEQEGKNTRVREQEEEHGGQVPQEQRGTPAGAQQREVQVPGQRVLQQEQEQSYEKIHVPF